MGRRKGGEKVLKWLAQKWAVNDPRPRNIDLVVAISYAATETRLTNGSQSVLKLAKIVADAFPEAMVAWGWFSKNSNRFLEKEVKSSVLGGTCVGPVSSSTDECEAIRESAIATGRPIRTVVVIAEGAHSRRCKQVWECMFPGTEICFWSVAAWLAADKKNPMWLQRYWRVWLLANIVLYPLYRFWPGVAWFAKHNFSQPAA
jgi:2-polyprenyl-6-methoxyphenol hydroxylase-like FAD-dependent oxidoreductase